MGRPCRNNDNEVFKKIMKNTGTGRTKVGGPRSRWMDSVLEGIRRLKMDGSKEP